MDYFFCIYLRFLCAIHFCSTILLLSVSSTWCTPLRNVVSHRKIRYWYQRPMQDIKKTHAVKKVHLTSYSYRYCYIMSVFILYPLCVLLILNHNIVKKTELYCINILEHA